MKVWVRGLKTDPTEFLPHYADITEVVLNQTAATLVRLKSGSGRVLYVNMVNVESVMIEAEPDDEAK